MQEPSYRQPAENDRLCSASTCLGKTKTHYCVMCGSVVCTRCKRQLHRRHRCRILREEVERGKQILMKAKDRLTEAYCYTAIATDDTNRERQALSEKKSTLINYVSNKHEKISLLLQLLTSETLNTVDYYSAETERTLSVLEDEQSATLRQIVLSQEQLENTLNSDNPADIIKLSKRYETQKVPLITKEMKIISRPALSCSATSVYVEACLESYIGGIHQVCLEAETPELKKIRKYFVTDSKEYKIVAVCHDDSSPPALSVVQEHVDTRVRRRIMVEETTGNILENVAVKAVAQGKRYAEGKLMFATAQYGGTSSFSKSLKSDHFRLNTPAIGRGKLFRVSVKSTNPFLPDYKSEMLVKVNNHRSFDVDDRGKAFVVLEEAQEPKRPRIVRLYRKGYNTAVATYQPSVEHFQPSDVCFYRLKGMQVLLVADEGNDVVHVVDVGKRKLIFQRFLALGPNAFFKPVCLNVDINDRLWLACQNGYVMCVGP